jgi:hypothetical protein
MLDINTPRGQVTLLDEIAAVKIFESNHPGRRYFNTPKDDRSDVDGLIFRIDTSVLTSVVETKCRYDMTLEKFAEVYGRKWLVTFDKILRGIKVAEALRVPFGGFLYIVPSRALLTQCIWKPDTGFDVDLEVRKTTTQATVNGGMATRDNAFLDLLGVEPLYLREAV